jgi:hypothetical protein
VEVEVDVELVGITAVSKDNCTFQLVPEFPVSKIVSAKTEGGGSVEPEAPELAKPWNTDWFGSVVT